MNKHILKILCNRRKDFIWIFIEQILVFVVLFYCMMEIHTKLDKYLEPGNLNQENVCSLGIIPNGVDLSSDEKRIDFFEKQNFIMKKMENCQYVESVHKGYYSVPGNRPSSNNKKDSLSYRGRKYPFYLKTSDENFQKVFRVKMLEGTWFKDEALADGTYPAVLTKSLVNELGLANPLGIKLNYMGRDFTITGVINDYKSFIFDDVMPSAIFANSALADGNNKISNNIETAMRVKEGQMPEFVNYFWKEAQKAFPNEGHQFLISDLGKIVAVDKFEAGIMLLFIGIIPAFFLSIFAFLGIFSLMYRLSKRDFSEYGLRMALGNTKGKLRKMVISQILILVSIASLVGFLIAVNIYLFVFSGIALFIFLKSVISALLLMLIFSIISVWYPAQRASRTQPAIALKQE